MAGAVKVMRLRHLVREMSSTLELALVGKAPTALIEELASATGFLVALAELPLDTDGLRLCANDTITRAERALEAWATWESERRAQA